MSTETRLEVMAHAARWANNMLNEVQANHGVLLGPHARQALKTAVLALGDFLLHVSVNE
jgi:hypothetical protein